METTKRIYKTMSVGEAAVEGLLGGILAGIVMGAFLLLVEFVAGSSPLTVLGYFDAGGSASPLVGLLTHIAVSGIYGVVFGIAALVITKTFGRHLNLWMWLTSGLVYGILILGIAEGILLPGTNSLLYQLPTWAMALAHALYGLVLAWLIARQN